MVKNIFKEKLEGYTTELGTLYGILTFIASIMLSGYILVNYNDNIISFWRGVLPKFEPLLWVALDLTYTAIYLIMLYILVTILKKIGPRNRKLFK